MNNPNVAEIWYQEPAEGVAECVSIRVHGGPKPFMRVWPQDPDLGVEWGWVLHESAVQIYPPPTSAAEPSPSHMSTLCVCGQNQQTAPFPGGNMFAAHSDAAGDPCPGLPLPFPPTVQEADR